MAPLDVETLLDRSEASLAALDGDHHALLWRTVRGHPLPGQVGQRPADHAAARAALLLEESTLERLEELYRRGLPGSPLQRRAALWLSAALTARAELASGQAGSLRHVAVILESFRGAVGQARPGLDELRLTLAGDGSRSRREQAFSSLVRLSRLLAPYAREALGSAVAAWRGQGGPDGAAGPSYWQQPLSPFRLEWEATDLPGLAAGLLEATDELAERFARYGARALGVRSLRPWDVGYALAVLGAEWERYFPRSDAASGLARGLRACGLPVEDAPLALELEPKWLPLPNAGLPALDWLVLLLPEGADAGAFSAGAAEPARGSAARRLAVIADQRRGAQHGWTQLAVAMGCALSRLRCRATTAWPRPLPPRLDPGALLVPYLSAEPLWLQGQTTVPLSRVQDYLALGCQQSGMLHAVATRLHAALALSAWRRLEDPAEDPALVHAAQVTRAAGLDPGDGGPCGDLWALDLASLAAPDFWPGYFLAELAAAQARAYLLAEHSRLMGDRRTGEFLVECFWRHGPLVPAAQAVARSTGAPLGLAAFSDQLNASARP